MPFLREFTFDLDAVGKVALEMVGVDDDTFYGTNVTKLEYSPLFAWHLIDEGQDTYEK